MDTKGKHAIRSLTVAQLIEQLKKMPQDMLVGFEYGSSDYWRTMLVGSVRSLDTEEVRLSSRAIFARVVWSANLATVQWTDYHSCFKVPNPQKDIDRSEGETATIVLLR